MACEDCNCGKKKACGPSKKSLDVKIAHPTILGIGLMGGVIILVLWLAKHL